MLLLRRISASLILGLGLTLFCSATESRPNIVFILADDLTFRDLGAYGSPNARTPHIDQLAREGLRFDACFQATAMCSPTRHNLYTGLYPVRSGAYPQTTWVDPGVKSIAHFLRDRGYRVAMTGKRHVMPEASFPFDYLDPDTDPDLAAFEDYLTQDPTRPACVFLCFREPHTPWNKGHAAAYDAAALQLPPNFVDTPETRRQLTRYYAEVTHLDDSVGQVMEILERRGLAKDTLFIFAGEQGNAFPFAKWTLYDSGLQSAFIARWPGQIKPNTSTAALVEYVDVVPTLLEIAGGAPEPDLDGRSFLPVLLRESDMHKDVVFGIQTTRGIRNGSPYYGIRSARTDRFKYVMNLTPEVPFANNVTNERGNWSTYWPTWVAAGHSDATAQELVERYQFRPAEELYDVQADPFELTNLASDPAHQSVRRHLRDEVLAWMEQQGDEGQATEAIADQRSLKTPAGQAAAPWKQ